MPFANVPNVPGVPALPRDPAAPFRAAGKRLTQDAAKLAGDTKRWGLFFADGSTALDVNSIVSVDFDGEHDISTYPLEKGTFESYNKVERPNTVMVRVTREGDDATLARFKTNLTALRASLQLLTVITPQYGHANQNLTKVNFVRRGDHGVSMITADLRFMQVRETTSVAFSDTARPAGADQVDSGAVQTRDPSPTEKTAVDVFEKGPDGKLLNPAG